MLHVTPSSNRDLIRDCGSTDSIDGLPFTADVESSEGSETSMRGMAARATREHFPSGNGILAMPSPVRFEGINASLNADAIASNGESPDMSHNTSNVERGTDVDMDEGRIIDTAKEDNEPGTTISASRGPVLPKEFEGEIAKLKAQLLENGASKWAVELCDAIFKNGVTIEALEERMTREQCEKLRVCDGKKFRLFLEIVGKANGQTPGRHRCGLCPPGKVYKHHRDALRHLLKDHFGLSFRCPRWWVSIMTTEFVLTKVDSTHRGFTRPELTRHIKIKHGVLIDK
jgi:hypothetical protein